MAATTRFSWPRSTTRSRAGDVRCCTTAAATPSSSDKGHAERPVLRVPILTPLRSSATEILDDPTVDRLVRRQSQNDVARSNRILGGLRAVLVEIGAVLRELGREATLLDVGTGIADIPTAATRLAKRSGVRLVATGVDVAHSLLAEECGAIDHGV